MSPIWASSQKSSNSERYFSPPYPADTIVEVRALGLPELMLEIEAVAIVEGRVTG